MTTTPVQTGPVCPSGPQGFHLYDTTQADQPLTTCLECGKQADEVTVLGELIANEPPKGSVVLMDGPSGTAWQRHHATGSWKSTTGRSAVWSGVLLHSRPGSRVWLIYVPPADR